MLKLVIRHARLILRPLVAFALLTFAACGDDDDNTTDDTPTPEASPTAEATPDGDATPSGPTATPGLTDAPMELEDFVIRPSVTRAPPGTINFLISNLGPSTHEFAVIRSDLPIAELPRLDGAQGVDESDLDVLDRSDPIPSGDEAALSLELDAGEYVLICNFTSEGASHYLSGMYQKFTVESQGAAPPVATETPIDTATPEATP